MISVLQDSNYLIWIENILRFNLGGTFNYFFMHTPFFRIYSMLQYIQTYEHY